jgi:hypothetical protein
MGGDSWPPRVGPTRYRDETDESLLQRDKVYRQDGGGSSVTMTPQRGPVCEARRPYVIYCRSRPVPAYVGAGANNKKRGPCFPTESTDPGSPYKGKVGVILHNTRRARVTSCHGLP